MNRSKISLVAFASALALTLGAAATTQAGIIPWVYDAIFGPVRGPVAYPAPMPAYSYAPGPVYSYSPSIGYMAGPRSYRAAYGCGYCAPSPCRVSCNACQATPSCSVQPAPKSTQSSAPTTVAFYHPFYGWVAQTPCTPSKGSQKNAARTAKNDDATSGQVGSQAPDPKDPKTFDKATGDEQDPFVPPRTVKKPVPPRNPDGKADSGQPSADQKKGDNSATATTTTTTTSSDDGNKTGAKKENKDEGTQTSTTESKNDSDNDTGFANQPQRVDDKKFVQPKQGSKPDNQKDEKTETGKAGDLTEELKLDNKSSWVVPSSKLKRVAFRPGFGNARLARQSKNVGVEFIIPAKSVTRIVSK